VKLLLHAQDRILRRFGDAELHDLPGLDLDRFAGLQLEPHLHLDDALELVGQLPWTQPRSARLEFLIQANPQAVALNQRELNEPADSDPGRRLMALGFALLAAFRQYRFITIPLAHPESQAV